MAEQNSIKLPFLAEDVVVELMKWIHKSILSLDRISSEECYWLGSANPNNSEEYEKFLKDIQGLKIDELSKFGYVGTPMVYAVLIKEKDVENSYFLVAMESFADFQKSQQCLKCKPLTGIQVLGYDNKPESLMRPAKIFWKDILAGLFK